MPWTLTEDLEVYAARAWDVLAADPAEQTIALVALETLRGGHRWSDEPMLFGWYEDGDAVRGAVMYTPPFDLLLALVPPGGTAELVEALQATGTAIPGAQGRPEDVERFAAAWTEGTPLRAVTALRLQLYALGALRPPDPAPPGRARCAGAAEFALALRWFTAFQAETGGPPIASEAMVGERVNEGRVWLWEDGSGAPVAFATRTRPTSGVARVAPVYTPPEHRRRGYGAAITAACTADALDGGAEQVVLFADMANPTTNEIYRAIGYEPMGERRVVRFAS